MRQNVTKNFNTMLHFYNPYKLQKTKVFLTFSGDIEIEYCAKMD